MTVVGTAVFYGALSAVALPLGALIGVLFKPPDRLVAILLAFGGGALLAALTLDLVAPGIDRGHFEDLAIGCVLGGLLFKGLDRAVNRKGGYLRKPSTALTHWRGAARTRLANVLGHLRRVNHFGELDDASREQLLRVLTVVDVPAETWIYRAGEAPRNLYIVERGEISLVDPATGEVFDQLSAGDAFGRMSFITGLPRATEARTRRQSRLLRVSRDQFLALVHDHPAWRRTLLGMVDAEEVEAYLHQRQGVAADEAVRWRQEAVNSIARFGHYAPLGAGSDPTVADMATHLAHEQQSQFFGTLPMGSVAAIAAHMTHRVVADGDVLHHAGRRADRLSFVRAGVVHLIDPDALEAAPEVVSSGETFSALAFLTGAPYDSTAVAHGEVAISSIDRADFATVLDQDDGVRHAVGEYLRAERVGAFLTRKQHVDMRRASAWIDRSVRGVEGGHLMPTTEGLTPAKVGGGAAMAIFLGILLDGIPESFVIGANVLNSGGITLSLLAGLFLANFPEALSSAAGMRDQGMSARRILVMWIIVMVVTGVGAGVGAVVLQEAPGTLFAFIEGLAAGAMLTMIAETMLPEAYHKGGGVVGLSTLGGFLAAILANHVN